MVRRNPPTPTTTMKKFLSFLLGGLLLLSASLVARAQTSTPVLAFKVQPDLTVLPTDIPDFSGAPLEVRRGADGRYPSEITLHTRIPFPQSLPFKHTYTIEVREAGRLVGTGVAYIPANAVFAGYLTLPRVKVSLVKPGVPVIQSGPRYFSVHVLRSDGARGAEGVSAILL